MGYLKRFDDRTYRIQYDVLPVNGRRRLKRETLKNVTKKEAAAILAQREAKELAKRKAVESGEHVKDEVMLSELFDGFIKAKTTNRKASTTLIRYESLVRLYLKPRFGPMRASALKPFHLTNAYADLVEHGRDGQKVSTRTVRHAHELLRNVLQWGVRRELLSRNVAALIEDDDLPKTVKPRPTALTEVELRKLLDEAKSPSSRSKKRGYLSAQPWFYPAVAFAAFTGARRGEVLALRWSDVNFELGSLTIERSVTERMEFKATKNDKSRTISMSEPLDAILEAHRAQQATEKTALGLSYRDEDLVFARADGTAVDPWNFGRAVLDCIRRAKVTPITLHGLRDTHASLLAKAGVPIEVISQRLGHASIGVTVERYLHVYRSRDAEAAAAFSRLVGSI